MHKATLESLSNPNLFKELDERFQTPPSEDALKSYLKRESFLERAINPVTSSYLETCSFLRQEGAYDSDVPSAADLRESTPELQQETKPVHTETAVRTSDNNTHSMLNQADVLNLSGGGQAALRLPESLTQTEYEDLKDWLDLMARRAKRRVSDGHSSEGD
ncbi:MAG: hypothetical protein NXH78_00480 [Hyphomonadaceae bacterium]|nr:hypothetical protein [Hyphomonadaceae bacterium]